jgi:histidinol-phosphate aminotransferase
MIPRPTPQVAAVPASTPFVAPEALARRVGRDSLVRLGANESAFGPSPKAIAAMQAALGRTSWYGDPESRELREALALERHCAVENIVVGSGIDDLLGLVVRTYLAPGATALATRGTYPTFAYHVSGYGGKMSTVDARSDGSVDIDGMIERSKTLSPAIVYLANPDNPSGTMAAVGDVERLRAALPAGTLFVLDEAYVDFSGDAGVLDDAIVENTIRMRTFSKAHGLAGARIAYAIAAPEIVATFEKIRLHFGVNRTAQIGALAALNDRAYTTYVVGEVARGRDAYVALGRKLGVATLASATNFVCFRLGSRAEAEALVAALLERGIFVRKPGAPPIDDCIRVTVGTPGERAAFADAFAEALDALREKAIP